MMNIFKLLFIGKVLLDIDCKRVMVKEKYFICPKSSILQTFFLENIVCHPNVYATKKAEIDFDHCACLKYQALHP